MDLSNLSWWILFFIFGIWAQFFVPGVDFLVVGVMLALQEGRWPQTLWVLLFAVLIQEGQGSLAFGSSLLWYAAAIVLFRGGRWLFQARNVFFMMLLGACLGVIHLAIMRVMTYLQNYDVQAGHFLVESVIQALIIPMIWLPASWLRPRQGGSDAVSI